MVNAWAVENRLVLGQIKTEDKSDEIKAIPELFQIIDIKGCVVTLDAMGCQGEDISMRAAIPAESFSEGGRGGEWVGRIQKTGNQGLNRRNL